jgi:ubiquinone/menaquinone biosynthesis C-methylase UbiE
MPHHQHDYLPAAGHDRLLPCYDLIGRVLGVPAHHRALLEQAELETATDVLEVGCGTGNLTVMAKRRLPGLTVVGVDPDPLALARAQRKAAGLPGIRFDRGYGQDLPYPDGAFDRVLSALMLHHLPAEEKPALLTEVRRVLRPGGALHLMDIGGRGAPGHGFLARRLMRSGQLADQLGDGISTMLHTAGFTEVSEPLSRRSRFGRLTWYRAR